MSFFKNLKSFRDSQSYSNQASKDSSSGPKTFITNYLPSKKLSTPGEDLINDYFEQINLELGRLGLNMNKVIKKREDDFVNAFKGQLNPLYKELNDLKKQNSKNQLNIKRDLEVNKLHEILSNFEKELALVSDSASFYKSELDKLKAKVQALNNDKEYLEEQIVGLKHKLTQSLNEINRLKSSGYPSRYSIPEIESKSRSATPRNSRSPAPSYTFVPVSKAGYFINEIMRRHHPRSSEFVSQLEHFMIVQENKFLETIQHYKKIIEKMKLRSRNDSLRKEEHEMTHLEILFLKCVEDIQKDRMKNRKCSHTAKKLSENNKQSFLYDNIVFSSLDRKKLIEKLMGNDYVLEMIYTTMFNRPPESSKESKIAETNNEDSIKLENLEGWLDHVPNSSSITAANTASPSRIMTPAPPSFFSPDSYPHKHRHYLSNIKS